MYSKNDYRYYLENQLAHSDDFLAHYGVRGMKWRKRKGPDQTVADDQLRGMKRTRDIDVRRLGNAIVYGSQAPYTYKNKKTKAAPNMYSTKKKSNYSKNLTNKRVSITNTLKDNQTGKVTKSHTEYTSYGRGQKALDKASDKIQRTKAINASNSYKVDKNKSLKENIQSNVKTAKKRKRLKKASNKRVNDLYK